MFCKVLEQVFECFGAAITKKNRIFLPKNGQKMPFCSLKQRFWGLNGQL